MKTVSVIGYGRIGSALVHGIADLTAWKLGRVLTRHRVPGLEENTTDVKAFVGCPADVIVDAAGPEALRALAPLMLSHAPLWSVGAVAMADPAFRSRVASASRKSGYSMRLFACGMANMPLPVQRLQITMRGAEIEQDWNGPLSHAVARWPDKLNTAVAAALNGPGLKATELTMEKGDPDALHEIVVTAESEGVEWHRSVRFEAHSKRPHPVAQMLLCELSRATRQWQGV